MKKQLLRLLLCAGLLAGLFTLTALAAEWTYDPAADTLTSSDSTVTLKNVTDDGANGLTIGDNQDFTGVTLDLTGQITDGSGAASYTLTTIGDNAFYYCTALTDVKLPETLTSIGEYAFFCCGFTTLDLSGCTNLTSIESYAFSNCAALTDVKLPKALGIIKAAVFSQCRELTALDLSGCTSLIAIGDQAFSQCEKLTTLDLSGCTSLGTIGGHAFYDCGELTGLDLSGCTSLDTIGTEAFKLCKKLAALDLSGCTSLRTIEYQAFNQCFSELSSTVTLDLSGCTSLRTINYQAFSGCLWLEEVTLPESLTIIEGYAFDGCSFLTQLVLLSQTPPWLDNGALPTDNPNFRIVVPAGCEEAYKEATGWSGVADFIFESSSDLTVTTPTPSLEVIQIQGIMDPPIAQFTVTNAGTLAISGLTVSLSDDEHFRLETSFMDPDLDPNQSTTFTAAPKNDLPVGDYVTTITVTGTVTGNQSVTKTATLTCAVKKAEITAAPTSLDFGSTTQGGARPAAQAVVVTNTGNVTVTVEEPFTSYYDTAITAGDLELAPGESVTFSVQPEERLEAGSYNSPLSIGGKIDPSSRQFIYAQVNLTYSVEPGGGDSGSSGGGSGNGGHTIWLPRPEHGRVTVSPSSAAKGSVVTLTVTADTGFALKTLTVTDGQGNQLKLDDKGNGKYTFTMPGSQVEISASFQEIAAQPESLPFADVAETAWYYDGVAYVYEKGLMTGTSAAAFSPNLTTSRSMVAAILWRLAGSPAADDPVDFADVAQGQWYTDAIRWAASEGIVGGYGDGTFGADDPITREQLAVMLYRFAQIQGYDVSVGENTNILSYADAADVNEWAVPALQWACGAGLITGTGDGSTLSPQGQATRAEAAVLLMRWQEALS